MANKSPSQAKALPIKEAANFLGVKPQYVRTLIRNGKFKPTKVAVAEGSEVWRWEIPVEQLESYRANAGTRSRRADGRTKYIMYATPEELEQVNAVAEANEIGVIIQRAYKPKTE
jgi:hypothetical protein